MMLQSTVPVQSCLGGLLFSENPTSHEDCGCSRPWFTPVLSERLDKRSLCSLESRSCRATPHISLRVLIFL